MTDSRIKTYGGINYDLEICGGCRKPLTINPDTGRPYRCGHCGFSPTVMTLAEIEQELEYAER